MELSLEPSHRAPETRNQNEEDILKTRCFAILVPLISLLLVARHLSEDPRDELIIWNVGQGQWVTLRGHVRCLHFDIGGEHADWSAIRKACHSRENRVFLSHWDWDHISFIKRATRALPGLCLERSPSGPAPSRQKQLLIDALPRCPRALAGKEIHEIPVAPPPTPRTRKAMASIKNILRKAALKRRDANSESRVFLLRKRILVPGDSPSQAEQTWANRLPGGASVRILILGHHGSKSSTSAFLLSKLNKIGLSIASSRRRRYGHPHPTVVNRLKERGVAVLTTEEWGHIRLQLPFRMRPIIPSPSMTERAGTETTGTFTRCKGDTPC